MLFELFLLALRAANVATFVNDAYHWYYDYIPVVRKVWGYYGIDAIVAIVCLIVSPFALWWTHWLITSHRWCSSTVLPEAETSAALRITTTCAINSCFRESAAERLLSGRPTLPQGRPGGGPPTPGRQRLRRLPRAHPILRMHRRPPSRRHHRMCYLLLIATYPKALNVLTSSPAGLQLRLLRPGLHLRRLRLLHLGLHLRACGVPLQVCLRVLPPPLHASNRVVHSRRPHRFGRWVQLLGG